MGGSGGVKRAVLITGGRGYIGGRVCSYLARNTAHSITATSSSGQASLPELEVGLAHLDLTDGASIRRACVGMNVVVHLAAPNENVSAANPERALTETGLGTLMLIDSAIEAGVERFIYVSTAHVYGAPLEGRIDEATLPRPIHPYAIAHRVAEDLVLAAHDAGRLSGIVLRLSNAVGAPARAGVNRWTLIATELCKQAIEKGELRLRTPGLAQRDFVPLSDVARAVNWAIDCSPDLLADGLFNLGGARTLRIIDLAEIIQRRCEATLAFHPTISRPSTGGSGPENALDYRIDKILNSGFILTGSLSSEIDATLRLCQESFIGDGRFRAENGEAREMTSEPAVT